MRALVLADAVIAILDRSTALRGDDRVRMDARRDRQGRECVQEGIRRVHVVERGWNRKWRSQLAGPTQLRELNRGLGQPARQIDELVAELDDRIARQISAAMRRRDEDHLIDERQRFDEQRAREQVASLRVELRLLERALRNNVPEAI